MKAQKISADLFGFLVSISIVFVSTQLIMRLLPGNAIEQMIAESGSKLSANEIQEILGLNVSLPQKIESTLKTWVHGDFGRSMISGENLGPLIQNHLLSTFRLSALAFFFGMGLALLLSALWILSPRSPLTRLTRTIAGFLQASSIVWFGPVCLLLFCVFWNFFEVRHSLTLQVFCLSLISMGHWSPLIHQRIDETLHVGPTQNAAMVLLAKGASPLRYFFKAGLMPASGVLIAFAMTQFGQSFLGAFITETVFSTEGMGTFIIESILKRDIPAIESSLMISTLFVLGFSKLGDCFQLWISKDQR